MSLIIQLVTAILLLALTGAAVVAVLAWARLRPPRLTDGRALFYLKRLTPEDLQLSYEVLRFEVPEHGEQGRPIRLVSWWVPHPQADGRTVVLLHGYADAKVGSAAWLPMLHAMGCNALLLDLPAHGESEGTITTAGWYERHQVRSVLQQLMQQKPEAARKIVLFGISQGAAVALATASVEPAVAGVIADSPFSDIRKAAVLHAGLFGLPGAVFQIPAGWLIERTRGIRYGEVAPMHLLQTLACPVLLISSGKDTLVSEVDSAQMKDAVLAKEQHDKTSRVLEIPAAPHILGLATEPERYQQALREFLAATLG